MFDLHNQSHHGIQHYSYHRVFWRQITEAYPQGDEHELRNGTQPLLTAASYKKRPEGPSPILSVRSDMYGGQLRGKGVLSTWCKSEGHCSRLPGHQPKCASFYLVFSRVANRINVGRLKIEGEDDAYDFGSGAGFYVNATKEPWAKGYNMYTYITEELPEALFSSFDQLDSSRVGITGHSMGGHGALTLVRIYGLKENAVADAISISS